MKEKIILFGAGEIGREALAFLRSQGTEPLCFADNDPARQCTVIDGVYVHATVAARYAYPDATWVATVLSLPASQEVPAMMKQMGVKTMPLWKVLPPVSETQRGKVGARYGRRPSNEGASSACNIVSDEESRKEILLQFAFYVRPDYEMSQHFHPLSEIYFPEFIKKRDDEVFMDCGAAGADHEECSTFLKLWPSYREIILIEPDYQNWLHLHDAYDGDETIQVLNCAISDHTGKDSFLSTGDYCARLGEAGLKDSTLGSVACMKIDDLSKTPTFIKMDVEGSEPEALWGARRTIREHSPVLAICCYHETEHFWQIPLLIHALNPSYKLFFRRYAPVPFELIMYAVPPDRLLL